MSKTTIDYRWSASAKRLIPVVNMLHGQSQTENVTAFINLLEHHILHYGEEETIRLLKSYRLYLQQIALKQPVVPIPFCKTTKSGFPKILLPWEIGVDSDVYRIRYVMSFWRILEVFRCKPEYKVETIINNPVKD